MVLPLKSVRFHRLPHASYCNDSEELSGRIRYVRGGAGPHGHDRHVATRIVVINRGVTEAVGHLVEAGARLIAATAAKVQVS